MSSAIKPLKLWSHVGTPNPDKVVVILNELGLAYEPTYPTFHQEPYISINPNGRVPALHDPNTGITLWESGSIIEYLLDTYDKEATLHYTEFPAKYEQSNWKHFQMSGQGPYFGQYFWFKVYSPVKDITTAIDRYRGEIKRVWSVIDYHLNKTGRPYLVGDKATFADLMFVGWNNIPLKGIEGIADEIEKEFPKAWAWHQKLNERESVKKMYEAQAVAKQQQADGTLKHD